MMIHKTTGARMYWDTVIRRWCGCGICWWCSRSLRRRGAVCVRSCVNLSWFSARLILSAVSPARSALSSSRPYRGMFTANTFILRWILKSCRWGWKCGDFSDSCDRDDAAHQCRALGLNATTNAFNALAVFVHEHRVRAVLIKCARAV